MPRRIALGCAAAAVLATAGGCLERTVTVTSDPPGAVVVLNNTEVGRTPVTTGFLFYGDYSVEVRKEGYQAVLSHHDISAPIYEQPPLDLIATALPVRIKTQRSFNVTLQPLAPDTQQAQRALVDRADQMRTQVVQAATPQGPATGAP